MRLEQYSASFSNMAVSLAVLLITVAVPLLALLLLSSSRKRANGRRLAPSPLGLPLLGHFHLLGRLPHRALQPLVRSHGPVMLMRLGRVPTVVVSSAAAARQVLNTCDPAFASHTRSPMIRRLFYDCDMAFAPYGEHWRLARRVCVLHLLGQRHVLSFRRVREKETAALLYRIRAAGRGAVNLSDLLISYTSTVIFRAAFGDDFSSYGLGEGGQLRKVFANIEELISSGTLGEFVPWLAWVDTLRGVHGKATRVFEETDGLLDQVIADHRVRRRGGKHVGDDHSGGGTRNFVDVLLDVSEEGEIEEPLFDTLAIKAIILDMFIAGTNNTYVTLEWAMAELINHPDEMRRLQKEIRAAVGDDDHITEDHLHKLRYLKSVIKETLRLHPPAPLVPREANEDAELLGYHVPARTSMLVNIWAIGRNPATWERAEEFLPERFAEDVAMDQYMVGQDLTLLPFGAGRRGCPGAGFGMASVELVLASLLYHFDWGLPGGASTVDMEEKGGLAVRLKKTLHVTPVPWNQK